MCHTSLVLALFMSMSLSVSAQKGCKVIHFREWWSYRNEYYVRGPQIVWISTYFMYNIPKYLPANIYVTYCRTIMGISCMHNFKQQVVGTRVVGAYYLAERKFAYRLCRAKHTIQPLQQNNNNCISIFFSTFSENKKRNRRTKNRENRGKNIFSIECVLTQDNLFEEPTSIIQRRRLI